MQFHFQRPFKVLLDGNFLHACIKNKINVRDRMSNTLSDPQVELLVPEEVIDELTSIGAPCAEALSLATTFKRAPFYGGSRKRQKETNDDSEENETISAAKGILNLLGQNNRHQYLVATQDPGLRKSTNKIPGVPVLYLNIGVSVIEPPSRASREYQQVSEKKKLAPRKDERRRLQQRDQEERSNARPMVKTGRDAELNLPKRVDVQAFPEKSKKRKGPRGPKQPNPLSMKKKKKRKTDDDSNGGGSNGGASKEKMEKRREKRRRRKLKQKVKKKIAAEGVDKK